MSNDRYARRSEQSATDKFLEAVRIGNSAQRLKTKRDFINALNAQRAEALQSGALVGDMPEYSDTSSLADIANASRRLESVVRKTPGGATRTVPRTSPAPKAPLTDSERVYGTKLEADPPLAEIERMKNAGTINEKRAGEMRATSETVTKEVGADKQKELYSPAPTAPVGPKVGDVRTGGAGREMMILDSKGKERWIAAPLSGAQTMNDLMGRRTPAERAARLKEILPTARQAGVTVGSPQTILSDELGRNRTVGESLPGQTVMGRGTVNPDGTIASITGGAGITDVTGGRTTRSASGNVAVGRYGSGSSTFDAIPTVRPPASPAPTPVAETSAQMAARVQRGTERALAAQGPALGSQLSTTTGVKAATPAAAPSTANTNLSGPASSTGTAWSQAPKPVVPMPATSPIASNATAPSVAAAPKPYAIPELSGVATAPAWSNPAPKPVATPVQSEPAFSKPLVNADPLEAFRPSKATRAPGRMLAGEVGSETEEERRRQGQVRGATVGVPVIDNLISSKARPVAPSPIVEQEQTYPNRRRGGVGVPVIDDLLTSRAR